MQKKVISYTKIYNEKVSVLTTEVSISKAFKPSASKKQVFNSIRYKAIWDTGTTITVITERIIRHLGLKPNGEIIVRNTTCDKKSKVFLVNIILPNNIMFDNLKVTEGKISSDVDVLIGMDIISKGDFAITNKDSKTVLSFGYPSSQVIDFTGEISQY